MAFQEAIKGQKKGCNIGNKGSLLCQQGS